MKHFKSKMACRAFDLNLVGMVDTSLIPMKREGFREWLESTVHKKKNTAKVKEMLHLFPSQASTCNLIRCARLYIAWHFLSIGKKSCFCSKFNDPKS